MTTANIIITAVRFNALMFLNFMVNLPKIQKMFLTDASFVPADDLFIPAPLG